MNKTTIRDLVGSIFFIGIVAALTYAFTGPTNSPSDSNSSAGSLVNQMAGSTFSPSTDSLEAIRDAINAIPTTTERGTDGAETEASASSRYDTLNTKVGTTTDTAGTTSVFSYLNKIDANTIGAASNGARPTMISLESGTSFTFRQAVDYCANLTDDGYDDWRLPSFEELMYIWSGGIADTRGLNSDGSRLWTSTPDFTNSGYFIAFFSMNDIWRRDSVYSAHFVRCVR